MNTSILRRFNIILFLLIAIVLLFFAFKGVDFKAIAQGLARANYWWVLLSVLVGASSHIIRALRWRLLMEPLGYNPKLLNTVGALMVGYLSNIVFPRLGEITRCGSIRRTDKVPFELLLGTVIVERAFDTLSMIILLLVVFLLPFEVFNSFIRDSILMPLYTKAGGALNLYVIVFALGALFLISLVLFLIRRDVFGVKLHQKISGLVWGMVDGLKSVYTMRRRKLFLLYTLLIWVTYWLMTYLLVFATAPTSHLKPVDALFLLVIGSLGMAAPVQGGFGAFHIITAMGLSIYGISREDGLVFATISHESQTLLVVISGLAFSAYLFLKRRYSATPTD